MKKNSEPDKMRSYRFFKAILVPIFKFWYRPTIIGKENIPEDGAILIVGNHKHVYDQCLAIMATKRTIHYMAKKEYFEGRHAWFFRMVGCIPVDRSKKDTEAVSVALDVLNKKEALGLFPEGTRNKTGKELLPFKYGTVSMSYKTKALIVPFAITGKYRLFNNGLTIRFGKGFVADDDLEEANKKLAREIEKLISENTGK